MSTDYERFYRLFMPYAFKKTIDGKWILINREYQDISKSFHVANFDSVVTMLGYEEGVDRDYYYLYTDKTNPVRTEENMGEYLSKLSELCHFPCCFHRHFLEHEEEQFIEEDIERLKGSFDELNDELQKWARYLNRVFLEEPLSCLEKFLEHEDFKKHESAEFDQLNISEKSKVFVNPDLDDPYWIIVTVSDDNRVSDIDLIHKITPT
jgi:hypothetical protein